MKLSRSYLLGAALVLTLAPASLSAQLGRQQGLAEPNVAADTALTKLPGITPEIVEAIKAARPILSVTALDQLLASKNLTTAQRSALYGRMFVHVDVNRGTDAEFMLIPGMTAARLTAIKAQRPYKSFAQLHTALMPGGASMADIDKLEQYLFIPIELNTFTNEIMDTFASIGVGIARWKREFAEYRPWTSQAQFEREIGKYVRANPTEVQRLWRYVVINP
jgi:DNA uptake protein ComE-like DNA-binding protein